MKSLKILALAFSLFFPFTMQAQNDNTYLSFASEYSWLSFSSLNKELSQYGLAPVKRPALFQLSFRFYPDSLSRRFFAGWQLEATHSKNKNSGYVTKMGLYVVNINFFYTLWYSHRSLFYPGLGLGLMHDDLLLQDKSKTPPSFENALTSFAGSQHMTTDNLSLNLSVNYSWAINRARDLLLNLFAGYRLGLNHPHWKLETGESLSGAPRSSAGGFFAGAGFSL